MARSCPCACRFTHNRLKAQDMSSLTGCKFERCFKGHVPKYQRPLLWKSQHGPGTTNLQCANRTCTSNSILQRKNNEVMRLKAVGAAPTTNVFEAWGVSDIKVQLTMKHEVEETFSLSVSGWMDPSQQERDALSSALLACLMDLLVERQEALWHAVRHAEERHPGRLRAEVLARLGLTNGDGRRRARRKIRQEEVLVALEFQDLHFLCELLVPAVAQLVDDEMAQQLAGMETPTHLQSPASMQAYCARQLVMRPQWDQWKKAMRTGLLFWFRQQRAQQNQGSSAPPHDRKLAAGADPATASLELESGGVKSRSHPNLLSFTFAFPKITPEGLQLTERVWVRLEGSGAGQFCDKVERILLSAFSAEPSGLYSSMRLFSQGVDPLGCLEYPEEHIQQRLMKVALETLRLPVAQEFQCSFPNGASNSSGSTANERAMQRHQGEEQLQGGSAVQQIPQQAPAGFQNATAAVHAAAERGEGTVFQEMLSFGGTATELRYLVYVLAALEEGAFHPKGGSTSVWYPSDGRIQLQRYRRQGQLTYRLRVNHSSSDRQQQQQPKVDAELSRTHILGIIDCVDGFRSTHPEFAHLQIPSLP